MRARFHSKVEPRLWGAAAGVALAAALWAQEQAPARTATPAPRLSGGFGRPRPTPVATPASEGGGQTMSDVVRAAHEGQPPEKSGVTITDRSLVKGSEKASLPTSKPTPALSRAARAASPPSKEEGADGSAGAGRPGAGVESLKFDQADFRYPAYIQRLVQVISMNWFKPARTVQTSPVVHFEIHKDGTITDARVVTSSGLPFVDRAAVRAVIASSPLPPLPAEYAGQQLGIQVVFE